MDANYNVRLSRRLARVLRHSAAADNIPMGTDGYVKVSDLLSHPRFNGVTFSQIQAVVENNEKRRYQLNQRDGEWIIRANQGHSLIVEDLQLEKLDNALPTLIHGTRRDRWPKIQKQGLSKMKRNHVHLATGLPGSEGVISGIRHTCDVFIYIDMTKAMQDGISFYRSENGVILSSGIDGVIPPKYFARVHDLDGVDML